MAFLPFFAAGPESDACACILSWCHPVASFNSPHFLSLPFLPPGQVLRPLSLWLLFITDGIRGKKCQRQTDRQMVKTVVNPGKASHCSAVPSSGVRSGNPCISPFTFIEHFFSYSLSQRAMHCAFIQCDLISSSTYPPKQCMNDMHPLVNVLVFYCCIIIYCKYNGYKEHPLRTAQFCRSEVWDSLTGFFPEGLTRPKSRCHPGRPLGKYRLSGSFRLLAQFHSLPLL